VVQMSLGLACDLCGECVSVCSGKALTITSDELVYDGGKCTYCESCMDVCPECAIRITDKVE
jgi:ferredoxin